MSVDPWVAPEWERSALLVIDTQVDFLDDGTAPIAGTRAVVPAIGSLIDAFRAAGRPIVHVVRLYEGTDVDLARRTVITGGAEIVRPGSAGSQIVPEFRTPDLAARDLLGGAFQELAPHEWAMWKPRWNAFHRTGLDGFLRARDVTTVVIAGCNFPNCPRASVYGASERDFRVVIAADAISGVEPWHLTEAVRIGAVPLPAAEVRGLTLPEGEGSA